MTTHTPPRVARYYPAATTKTPVRREPTITLSQHNQTIQRMRTQQIWALLFTIAATAVITAFICWLGVYNIPAEVVGR